MIERVLIAGGGTGGHLFPGIAVVEELKRRNPALETLFVGTERGIEARVLPGMGERLELMNVRPLKGRGAQELIRNLAVLPRAGLRASAILRAFRPDVVIGVGGYASGPMLLAAAAHRIPTALLEQNVAMGMTNRLLAPIVGRMYLTFAESGAKVSPARARVCGNPVRRAFVEAAKRASIDPDGFESRARTLLVLGGSQGAKRLNEEVPKALGTLGPLASGYTIIHQTGEAERAAVEARYLAAGLKAEVVSFISDVAKSYAQAALVIARAGATTVAELCAIGRPAVLVPYPHAADDHQTRNAEALAAGGAAVVVRESELDTRLAEIVRGLLGDQAERRHMAEAARKLGRPDAAAAIVDDLCGWLGCPHEGERGGASDGEPGDDGGEHSPGAPSMRRAEPVRRSMFPAVAGGVASTRNSAQASLRPAPRPSMPPVVAIPRSAMGRVG